MISPGRVKPRESAVPTQQRPPPAKSKVFSAPRRGLVLTENLASQQPEGALVLDNWICTTTGVRARGGAKRRYTLDAAITSMWEFSGPAGKRKFAATATRIYDLTSVADPVAIPAYAVSGRTSGYYSTAHMATVGGHFLYAVNGSDPALLYDGAAFTAVTATSTPAITGVATSSLSFVWAYANRLFFVEKGTTRAWYLAVDSIAGAAQKFDLIFFRPHFIGLRVLAGNGIGAEFGNDDRLAKGFIQGIQLLFQRRCRLIQLRAQKIPAVIAIDADDIGN